MNTKEIRIKLMSGLTGKAPQAPEDADTFTEPQFWRGEKTTVKATLYNAGDTVETTTDITAMRLLISPTQDHAAPVVDLSATVANTFLDLSVTDAEFQANTGAHATFAVAASALLPSLAGAASTRMYMRLSATWNGNFVCLANGPCTIHEGGPLS